MADATIPILGLGTSAVPQDYVVKGGQVLGLSAVRAQFDGSGAAGAFLPCVQIVSAAGNVMSQTLSDSVAAGSSADVTFHPFRKKATSGGTGIQFDTAPQAGHFLKVTTTDNTLTSFALESGGEMDLLSQLEMFLTSKYKMELHTDDLMLIDSFNGITIQNTPTGQVLITNSSDQGTLIRDLGSAASNGVELFSNASVVQLEAQAITITCKNDSIYMVLGAGQKVQVLDSTNAPIFEVRDDGSLHGKTGQALTFDL